MEEKTMEEKTQWFILSKPCVVKYQVNIDEEIDEQYRVLAVLKRQKHLGLYWHNRTRRRKTGMGLKLEYKDRSDNKVVGFSVHKDDSEETVKEKRRSLYWFFKRLGYEPVCVKQTTTFNKPGDC